jgi:hypothetical protein
MKKSSVTSALVALLTLSVLVTAILSFWYVQSIRKLRIAQAQVTTATYNLNGVQALWNEATEFGKTNPRMVSLLKSIAQPPQAPPEPESAPILPKEKVQAK